MREVCMSVTCGWQEIRRTERPFSWDQFTAQIHHAAAVGLSYAITGIEYLTTFVHHVFGGLFG